MTYTSIFTFISYIYNLFSNLKNIQKPYLSPPPKAAAKKTIITGFAEDIQIGMDKKWIYKKL